MSREIQLSKGQVAIVDDLDYELVSKFKWHALHRGRLYHAVRTVKQGGAKKSVYMHRWLIGAPTGMSVDHKNGNGLDNRRDNLRICTRSQNAVNHRRSGGRKASRFHGVAWNSSRSRWRVVICAGDGQGRARQTYIGSFIDEIQAALAYDEAARRLHGEFAITNFPEDADVSRIR